MPNDYNVRSHRICDALRELRAARRIGRRLTDEEAQRLQQYPDRLQLRELVLRMGGKLTKHAWGLEAELERTR